MKKFEKFILEKDKLLQQVNDDRDKELKVWLLYSSTETVLEIFEYGIKFL